MVWPRPNYSWRNPWKLLLLDSTYCRIFRRLTSSLRKIKYELCRKIPVSHNLLKVSPYQNPKVSISMVDFLHDMKTIVDELALAQNLITD
ncbi:hypothetical protein HanIR_Chr12g0584171 [Helianthus annuus]|nr:hypothetical protein HanIR_Chr12g0584171 [Helianthus annuus]